MISQWLVSGSVFVSASENWFCSVGSHLPSWWAKRIPTLQQELETKTYRQVVRNMKKYHYFGSVFVPADGSWRECYFVCVTIQLRSLCTQLPNTLGSLQYMNQQPVEKERTKTICPSLLFIPYECNLLRRGCPGWHISLGVSILEVLRGCSYKRMLSIAETWSDVASLNVAVGNLAIVKRRHYISEMSQNNICFIQLHC